MMDDDVFNARLARADAESAEMMDNLAATKSPAFCTAVRALILIRQMHNLLYVESGQALQESHGECCTKLASLLLDTLDLEDDEDEIDANARAILMTIYKVALPEAPG